MKIDGRLLSATEFEAMVQTFDFGTIKPSLLVLHHTWRPTVAQWNGAASIKGLVTFYEKKGWPAGPHLFVGPDGIWLFTPMSEPGVASNAANANWEFQNTWNRKHLKWYSLSVEMVGDYDKVRPSGPVWENTKAVLGSLCKRLGLDPATDINFHRAYNTSKSCPGKAVGRPWVAAETISWMQARDLKAMTVIAPAGTGVYQGPATSFPLAGTFGAGTKFMGLARDDGWVWVATGLGFVQAAAVSSGMAVVEAPRMKEQVFARILADAGSPAAGWAPELWAVCLRYGIDPAVALAFFKHESSFGRAGLATHNKSWGNARAPEDPALGIKVEVPGRGFFARYASWPLGLEDWCKRLLGPKYAGVGLVTVEDIIPKYAPTGDGNSPVHYIADVLALVAGWSKLEV